MADAFTKTYFNNVLL